MTHTEIHDTAVDIYSYIIWSHTLVDCIITLPAASSRSHLLSVAVALAVLEELQQERGVGAAVLAVRQRHALGHGLRYKIVSIPSNECVQAGRGGRMAVQDGATQIREGYLALWRQPELREQAPQHLVELGAVACRGDAVQRADLGPYVV